MTDSVSVIFSLTLTHHTAFNSLKLMQQNIQGSQYFIKRKGEYR